jgi:hypothetical protein
MLPWSSEFVWDAGHLAFFGAFYTVLMAVGIVVALALRRARRSADRAPLLAWRAAFEELPRHERACRHDLTGELAGRVCDNAFDCRTCATHATVEPEGGPRAGDVTLAGLRLPLDRYYHRGHAYAKPQDDGTIAVGLDDLAHRLIGEGTVVAAPVAGARLTVNGEALRLRTSGGGVRVLSPVDGVVTRVAGQGADVVVRVDPGGPLEAAHLLSGSEVGPWILREIERLAGLAGSPQVGTTLADGGELVAEPAGSLAPERLGAVLGEMFLDV